MYIFYDESICFEVASFCTWIYLEKKAFSITVAFPTRQPYIDIVFKPLTFA